MNHLLMTLLALGAVPPLPRRMTDEEKLAAQLVEDAIKAKWEAGRPAREAADREWEAGYQKRMDAVMERHRRAAQARQAKLEAESKRIAEEKATQLKLDAARKIARRNKQLAARRARKRRR